jgi:hypothetical protein
LWLDVELHWTDPTVWSILWIKPGYFLPELAYILDQAISAVQICQERLFNFLSHDLTIHWKSVQKGFYGVYNEYLNVKLWQFINLKPGIPPKLCMFPYITIWIFAYDLFRLFLKELLALFTWNISSKSLYMQPLLPFKLKFGRTLSACLLPYEDLHTVMSIW